MSKFSRKLIHKNFFCLIRQSSSSNTYFVKGDRPPVLSLNELAPVLGLNKPNSYMLIVFAKYM